MRSFRRPFVTFVVVIFHYTDVDLGFVVFHTSGNLSAVIHFRQRLQRDKWTPLHKIGDVQVAIERREIVELLAGANKASWNSKFVLDRDKDPAFAAPVEFGDDQAI